MKKILLLTLPIFLFFGCKFSFETKVYLRDILDIANLGKESFFEETLDGSISFEVSSCSKKKTDIKEILTPFFQISNDQCKEVGIKEHFEAKVKIPLVLTPYKMSENIRKRLQERKEYKESVNTMLVVYAKGEGENKGRTTQTLF